MDHIRYDLLTQQALRTMVRNVLSDTARNGLPGDHHFYISFDTEAPGVRMSARLREQYPKEMTVVLQHQFWDLSVNNDGFEVGLSFGGVSERLGIPFEAIKGFFDPSVQFGLQFEVEGEGAGATASAKPTDAASAASDRPPGIAPPAAGAAPASPAPTPQDKAEGGAEVVSLDRFRKK
jgi:hypothetical protein